MAAGEQGQVLVEAVAGHARRTVLSADVDVEPDRVLPSPTVVARLPLHVEELAAPDIAQYPHDGHVLAPAGLAPEAEAIGPVRLVVQLGRELCDLTPGWIGRHLHCGLLEQVGAIERQRALRIEGQGVELAVVGEAVPHGRDHVV